MQAARVALLPKLKLRPEGKRHWASKHQRKFKMQVVEQRVNRCNVDFVHPLFGFGRPGERELTPFKTEFKENFVFSQCISLLGAMKILSSVLELASF